MFDDDYITDPVPSDETSGFMHPEDPAKPVHGPDHASGRATALYGRGDPAGIPAVTAPRNGVGEALDFPLQPPEQPLA
jgi:hypothetical protein